MYNAPTQPYYRPTYNQPMYQQPQQIQPQPWQQMPQQPTAPQAWQPQVQPEPMPQPVPQQEPPPVRPVEIPALPDYQELTQAVNRLCDILETMRNDRKEATRQTWTSDK